MSFRVFIVEDFKHMQAALIDLLEDLGHFEVLATKETETAAIEWIWDHKGQWEVAILDLALADGTGFNLIQLCRAEAPAGIIIVLSDFVTPAIADRCKELGADAAFQKADSRAFTDYLTTLPGAQQPSVCATTVAAPAVGAQAGEPAAPLTPLPVTPVDAPATPLVAMPDAGPGKGELS